MTLSDDLRTHVDRAAPPITLAEVVTRAVPEPEAGSPGRAGNGPGLRWLVVAAALTLAVVGGLALVPRAGDDSGGQPIAADGSTDTADTDPGPTPSTVTVSGTVGAWQAIPAAEAFPSAEPRTITAVTRLGDGYLAVGHAAATRGAGAWISPDGRVWTERPLQATAGASSATTATGPGSAPFVYGRMDAVGTRGETVVAVGTDSGTGSYGPIVWRWRGDGDAVELPLPIDNPDASVTMAGVVATSRAFVVVGTDIFATRDGAVAWVSTDDGVTWSTAATFPGDVVITSLTALGDRLVAVGSTGGGQPSSAAWFSDDDGRTWTPAALPADAAGGGSAGTELVKVAAGGGRLLAYSTRGDVAPGGSRTDDAHQIGLPTELTLWSSADGASWTRGATIPLGEGDQQRSIWRSTLSWGPAGWLVTISPVTQAWLSPDGTTVTDTAYATGDPAAPWLRAAIGTPDGYLAIGDGDHDPESLPVSVAVLPVGD